MGSVTARHTPHAWVIGRFSCTNILRGTVARREKLTSRSPGGVARSAWHSRVPDRVRANGRVRGRRLRALGPIAAIAAAARVGRNRGGEAVRLQLEAVPAAWSRAVWVLACLGPPVACAPRLARPFKAGRSTSTHAGALLGHLLPRSGDSGGAHAVRLDSDPVRLLARDGLHLRGGARGKAGRRRGLGRRQSAGDVKRAGAPLARSPC